VDRGELSGAEFAASTDPVTSHYLGLEDWALYQQNRNAMRKGMDLITASEGIFQKIKEQLDKLSSRFFSESVKEMLEAQENFEADKMNLLTYIKSLLALPGGAVENLDDPLRPFPELKRLKRIADEWTDDLDEKAAIEKKYVYRQLKEFYDTKPKNITDASFVEAAEYIKLDPKKYSTFKRRTKLTKELAAMHNLRFLKELEKFQGQASSSSYPGSCGKKAI